MRVGMGVWVGFGVGFGVGLKVGVTDGGRGEYGVPLTLLSSIR